MVKVMFILPDTISITIDCTVESGASCDPVKEVNLVAVSKDGVMYHQGSLQPHGGIWKCTDIPVVNFREKALVLVAVSASGAKSVATPIIFECLPAAPAAPVVLY